MPRETRVSVVMEPWHPTVKVALWNGYAPQVIVGIEAKVTTYCYLLNCRSGTIDKTRARTTRGAEIRKRCSRLSARSRTSLPIPREEAVDEGTIFEIASGEGVATERRDGEEGAYEPAFREEGIAECSDDEGVVSETIFGEEVPAEPRPIEGVVTEEAFVEDAEILGAGGMELVLGVDAVSLLKAPWS